MYDPVRGDIERLCYIRLQGRYSGQGSGSDEEMRFFENFLEISDQSVTRWDRLELRMLWERFA